MSKFEIINYNEKIIEKRNKLGSGGNSIVYECKYNGRLRAIKFFKGTKERYIRFNEEITKINHINSKLENYTPSVIETKIPPYKKIFNNNYVNVKSNPFYIMEKANPYKTEGKTFPQKIDNIISITEQLKKIHELGIAHRDIKIDNIVSFNNQLTFIDFGTACIPGFETIDINEIKGSRDTIAPEMSKNIVEVNGYTYIYADIYSLGKTIWTILMNNKTARIFTTYDHTAINSKLMFNEGINEGIVMELEELITNCTKDSYLERINLEDILRTLKIIKEKLLPNPQNCNIVKFRYQLKRILGNEVDGIILSSDDKINQFITNLNNIGTIIGLIDENSSTNSTKLTDLTITTVGNKLCSFAINNINYFFKISEIVVHIQQQEQEKMITEALIYCVKTEELMNTQDSIWFSQIDNLSRQSILTMPLDDTTKKIYLDCIISMKTIDELE